jgi:hypothetical protein
MQNAAPYTIECRNCKLVQVPARIWTSQDGNEQRVEFWTKCACGQVQFGAFLHSDLPAEPANR